MSERTEVSWIILHPERDAVLVTADGGQPRLPSGTLPGDVWLGDAPIFVGALAALGLDAIVVGCRDCVYADDERAQHLTMVATLRSDPNVAPPQLSWAGQDTVTELPSTPVRVVRPGRPPWESPDWFPATEAWLRDELARAGRDITGSVEQHRSWELSSVLRVPTGAGPVWLKASFGSDLFADEGSVLALMADWFPEHVPALLAHDENKRLVLLDDFGSVIGRDGPLDVRERALTGFGRLQASTVDRLAALASAGLVDRGPSRLVAHLSTWLPHLDATARIPSVDQKTWLTEEECAEIAEAIPRLVELGQELAAGPVPLTLLHGDLHLGNVAAGAGWGRVFDWTDACIGHPFFDLITALDGPADVQTRLRQAYLAAWDEYASPAELHRLWRAAEILGPLHHAVSYAAISAGCAPPVDAHMASATAGWLRAAIAALKARASGLLALLR